LTERLLVGFEANSVGGFGWIPENAQPAISRSVPSRLDIMFNNYNMLRSSCAG
jgi:hypothetical protein